MSPKFCPGCAAEKGFDPKSVRKDIDLYLTTGGLSFFACQCGNIVVRKGIRGLIAGLEANSIRFLMRTKSEIYKNRIIG